MDYNLAKKLKDAGFPMKMNYPMYGGLGHVYCGICKEYMGSGDNTATVGPTHCGKSDIRFMIIPTLFELIEACGDRFISLNRFFDDHHQTSGWEAIGFGGKYPQIKREENIQGKGNTPEEAVANLWIKYHV